MKILEKIAIFSWVTWGHVAPPSALVGPSRCAHSNRSEILLRSIKKNLWKYFGFSKILEIFEFSIFNFRFSEHFCFFRKSRKHRVFFLDRKKRKIKNFEIFHSKVYEKWDRKNDLDQKYFFLFRMKFFNWVFYKTF